MKKRLAWMGFFASLLVLGGCDLFDVGTDPDEPGPGPDPTPTGYSGTISVDSTWQGAGTVFHIDGDLTITGTNVDMVWGRKIKVILDDNVKVKVAGNAKLTIQEGVEVTAGTGAYFSVGEGTTGGLVVAGTDSLPVRMGAAVNANSWGWGSTSSYSGGIWLGEKASSSTSFQHCIMDKPNNGFFVETGYYQFNDVKITNAKFYGIYFKTGSGPLDSANFLRDTITGSGEYPLHIGANALGRLSAVGLFSGAKTGIEVETEGVDADAVWRKHQIPYIFDGGIDIGSIDGATVTIRPGTVCKFDVSAYLDIGNGGSGTLIAEGTAQDSITFTALNANASWGFGSTNSYSGGIWIGNKATTNTSLKFCSISKATTGVFAEEGARFTLSNCAVTQSKFSGMYFHTGAGPIDSVSFVDNKITGNAEYAIAMGADELGALSGTGTVAGNTKGGIFVMGDIVDADAVWKKLDAPYFISGEVSIASVNGATVTVRPGVQFRIAQNVNFTIAASGTIIAEGTATDSIRFESAIAGAKWGDGTTARYSGGLWFSGNATSASVLKYCVITNATTGIYLDVPGITIQNNRIGGCTFHGIFVAAQGDQANVSNNTFSPANGAADIGVY